MAVHSELLKTVRQVTRGGSTWSVTMECLVDDLDGSGYAEGQKFQITDDADVALRADGFTPGSECPEHSNLVLSEVELEAVDTDKVKAYLTYIHRSDYEYQDLASPPGGQLWFNAEGGLAEVESEVDNADDAIVLTYIYPTGDPWFDPDSDKAEGDRTKTQGGRVQVKIPTKVATLRGILQVNDPDSQVVDGILGFVNDAAWRGGAAGTWLCTQANYVTFNTETSPAKYAFDFRFEYNADGWQPRAVFVHQGNGKIPGDWKTQNAYADVDWYRETDFTAYFAALGVAADAPPDF